MKPSINPPSFEELTKVEGPILRHIEQLWDEVKKLKAAIEKMQREKD